MPRFDPDPEYRPPLPGREAVHTSIPAARSVGRPPSPTAEGRPAVPGDTGGSAPEIEDVEIGEKTDKIQRVLGRRYLPTGKQLVPRFIRQRIPRLPPHLRERWEVISGFAQTAGLVIFACATLAIIISFASKATLVEPKSAKAVLELVEDPRDISYSVETVRTKRIDGVDLRQDSIRGFEVDIKRNKFQAQISGVSDDSFRLVGDGKILLYQKGGNTPARLNGYPSSEQVRPILPSEIKARAGDLLHSKLTVRGERGWLLTWNPTQEMILRMLSVDLLDIEGEDVTAIEAGDFTLDYATATVVRGQRQLYQTQVVLRANDAEIQILTTYRDQNKERLKNTKIGERTTEEVF